MSSCRCGWRRKSTMGKFLVGFGTAYMTLVCILGAFTVFPSGDFADVDGQLHRVSSKLHRGQEEWLSSPKKGAHPRNVHYEGHAELSYEELHNTSRKISQPVTQPVSENSTLANNFKQTVLSDIFIGVKTTEKYHNIRLGVLFETWLDDPAVREQTYFFTDSNDSKYYQAINGHFINTHCENRHTSEGLCCKMGAMFSVFIKSTKRWWCTMDDDNYLNVHNLLKFLRGYRHEKDYYFGRSSTYKEIVANDNGDGGIGSLNSPKRQTRFWFGTGGAGVCISRSLALKMTPYASLEEFPKTCKRISLPDDVSLGFIIVDLLGVNLSKVADMYSHLQPLTALERAKIEKAITLSYKSSNRVRLQSPAFNISDDPTMFKSVHCLLHPKSRICPAIYQ